MNYENGGFDIVISCIPKTLENGGKTNEEVLHEFKMRRYDEKGDNTGRLNVNLSKLNLDLENLPTLRKNENL